ncbi:hypothetical protein [Nocardiopsis alba]
MKPLGGLVLEEEQERLRTEVTEHHNHSTPALGTLPSRVVGLVAQGSGRQSSARTPLSTAAYSGHGTDV